MECETAELEERMQKNRRLRKASGGLDQNKRAHLLGLLVKSK